MIAQLHTSLSKLRTSYYSALVNWGDGVVQPGKLIKSGAHGFKLNVSHTYRCEEATLPVSRSPIRGRQLDRIVRGICD